MKPNRYKFATEARKATENSVILCVFVAILFAVIATTACNRKHEPVIESELPKHIQDIENVTIIAPIEGAVPETVKLIRDVVFESNDEVFIEGYISKLAVDKNDRVYIAATIPGTVGIYVFNPDGSYLTKFLQEGRGPGEYESLSSLNIIGERLYVYDTRLQKIGIFSLDGFTHIRDILIDHSLLKESEIDFLGGMIVNKLIVRNDESFIMRLKSRPRNDLSYQHKEIYLEADKDGMLLPAPILQVKSHTNYFPDEQLSLPFPGAFSRSSIVAVGHDDLFYSNWTEDFLINVHNSEGELEKSYYFPLQDTNLNRDDLKLDRSMERTLNKYELPGTWPAVHTMELDDEERLWVATITDSDSTFQWHVVNSEGELLARFRKPGNRTTRSVVSKPLHLIHNGYFYLLDRDLQQGIDRIVKYRIEFGDGL